MEKKYVIKEQKSIILSVIIPAYNVKDYIDECVKSFFFFQNKQNFYFESLQDSIEIIIVDDGSSDGTEELCEQYAKEYNCIRVLHQKNSGVSAARNNGLKNANGKWIWFVDSDDRVEFGVILEMLNKQDLDLYDVIVYSVEIERPNGSTIVSSNTGICYNYSLCDSREQFQQLCMQNQLYWPDVVGESHKYPIMSFSVNKLIKRNFLLQNSILMKENIAQLEDKIFNFECMSCARRVMFYDKVAYHYRYRPSSAIHSDGIKMIAQIRESIQTLSDVIGSRRVDALDQSFSYCCVQALWTIVDRLGNTSESLNELPTKAKLMKEFINEQIIKDAISKISISKVSRMKHRIVCWFLKHNMTLPPIGLCYAYHTVYK